MCASFLLTRFASVMVWLQVIVTGITGSGKSLTSFPRIPGAYRVNCIVLSLDLMY